MNQKFPFLNNLFSISIIDDDAVTIFLAKKTLLNFHPNLLIKTYLSGKLAINELTNKEENHPQIILLDINMPMYNGWDFLNDYSKINNNVNIFMFTSSVDPNDFIKSKTYSNVKGFISKPLDSIKIESIFENLLLLNK